jgi:hypothetical protein
LVESTFEDLLEMFTRKLGGVMKADRIYEFAMQEALKTNLALHTAAN